LTDTFLEKNGLLTEDRIPKAPIEALAQATRGPQAHLQDWVLDPLGHSQRWRTRRGPDFPVEWTRVGETAEVLTYPGERQPPAAEAPVPPTEPAPTPGPAGGPPGYEGRGRGAHGARGRRRVA
jgi:hypothetical protein